MFDFNVRQAAWPDAGLVGVRSRVGGFEVSKTNSAEPLSSRVGLLRLGLDSLAWFHSHIGLGCKRRGFAQRKSAHEPFFQWYGRYGASEVTSVISDQVSIVAGFAGLWTWQSRRLSAIPSRPCSRPMPMINTVLMDIVIVSESCKHKSKGPAGLAQARKTHAAIRPLLWSRSSQWPAPLSSLVPCCCAAVHSSPPSCQPLAAPTCPPQW